MQQPSVGEEDLSKDILTFLAGSPAGILLSDHHGVIRWSNAVAAQLFGYDEEGLAGRSIEDLIPSDLREWHSAQRQHFYADPRPRLMSERETLWGKHRAGHQLPIMVGLSEVLWRGQRMVISHVVDHTRQKQAEDDLRLQQALARAIAEAEDFDTAVSRVLKEMGTQVGASYAEAWLPGPTNEGFHLYLNWGRNAQIAREAAAQIRRVGPQAAQKQLQEWTAPGAQWLAAGISLAGCETAVGVPIQNQEKQIIALLSFYFVATPANTRHITDLIAFSALQLGNMLARKQHEAQLRRYADELESSHQQLAQTNRELEMFAMFVSHDLRAPVRAIHSYAQLLKMDFGQVLPAEGQEFLQEIQDNTQQMDALIQGLLAYARLGQHAAPEISEVDPKELLEKLIERLKLPPDARIELPGHLPQIFSNALLLRQIFENLLNNAIKYRRLDVPLMIQVNWEESDAAWIFSVQDNGIGIAPKFFAKIFEVLQRLHAPHEFEGTGIGLAITRRCVELMGGEISVESTPGAGSTFTFSLRKPSEE